ncbi:TRAP transporter large permease [Castellaniella sp. S9]|uniref:TRAP transporter large permease n=1 Tax=Castellaniella sp. S9 TaxID=2993652 RepID=UPI0022B3AC0E|nr:TRAP transporter large permease [Castellaniella sp. S9]
MISLTMLGIFSVLAVLGMPLAFALGWAGLGGVLLGGFPMEQLAGKMVYALDSFPLMAIPLFMLAGQLMVRGGIMERLIELADAAVGRVTGGLGLVTIGAAMGLSSVSGSSVADATALGSTLGPSLGKSYSKGFGAALVASASNLGPIIPPSIGMIVYAVVARDVSVGYLFVAGIVPGIFLGLGTMVLCAVIARRRGYPVSGEAFSTARVVRELRRSLIVFLMPVLVIGGIVGGVFTATEGAAIAVAYALAIGFFVTRKLRLSDLLPCLLNAAIITAIVGALIAFSSQVTYLLTAEMVAPQVAEWLTTVTTDPLLFTFLVMLMLVLVGMVMEANAAYLMLVPIIAPIAAMYGIDPVYFGFLVVMNITIGGITPPVGILLIVTSGIWRIKVTEIIREATPFIVLQYALLFLFTLFPDIILFLPRLLGY